MTHLPPGKLVQGLESLPWAIQTESAVTSQAGGPSPSVPRQWWGEPAFPPPRESSFWIYEIEMERDIQQTSLTLDQRDSETGTAQKELETKQCPTPVRRPWASRLSPTPEIQDTTHRGREVIKALRDCLWTRELTWQGLSCMEMVTGKTHNSRDRVWTAWRCPCAKHTQPRLVGFVIKALL